MTDDSSIWLTKTFLSAITRSRISFSETGVERERVPEEPNFSEVLAAATPSASVPIQTYLIDASAARAPDVARREGAEGGGSAAPARPGRRGGRAAGVGGDLRTRTYADAELGRAFACEPLRRAVAFPPRPTQRVLTPIDGHGVCASRSSEYARLSSTVTTLPRKGLSSQPTRSSARMSREIAPRSFLSLSFPLSFSRARRR